MTHLNADSRDALRFLDAMFDASAIYHLVAIPPDGKPIAKSFLPSQREALTSWINARQGCENVYFSVNRLEDGFIGTHPTGAAGNLRYRRFGDQAATVVAI